MKCIKVAGCAVCSVLIKVAGCAVLSLSVSNMKRSPL